MKIKRLLPYVFILTFVGLTVYLLSESISSDKVADIVKSTGPLAPLVFISLFASTHVLAPLSASPLLFPAFLLFGAKPTVFYMYLATVISSFTNFWISKQWGRSLVIKLVGNKNMQKIDEFTEYYGVGALIFLRLFSGYMTDFVSYAYGLTKIKFSVYFLISILVPIPWLLFWQLYVGNRVDGIKDFAVWVYIPIIPFVFITSLFIYKFKKKRSK
ncbi:hypothetical protein A3D84_05465 [Candidatus Woesebacteria bacterium RIFCSPHIGHO2_02_FULL_42_20]|uniref:TVP38/TMEM64 family membrane protein n=1 Tax=Candidatus Woesebacteria bacterium RIFCSPHIGHO2_12_FULL_41_24 TaxID=1802510 RepID=A0A1F8AQW8_9BACT|nr:MAG: hypothetical protein A2873_04520 [Candidatus Woesebacteria bacterium RIFCSPHIGHO2_01_FULL_42_80]OGM35492.1 MAG: hypothetical protein A3D84_05465 [Candidatus Woesebacteria bacterium RIFCSPHIGHO2_02_FULL_42_20]OGM54051.1 MAG: hypothetical protein A3E44_02625 [Candidatus Woesebacteria bacterium RIFCSPHIGHO2_12_FULL_41_24]OGM65881.1 MAG: hypothetical protein A2969_05670 [Candidatus Woesebacteria bacterium RIFCSPLOWO2_01_FULL_42_67]OGM70548.1 MAG: hypothetical protein A3I55_02150 [Candidatus